MIVFDLTDRNSFEHIEQWIDEIDKNGQENVLKFLVGNKCDLQSNRVTKTEEAVKLAKRYNMPYLETSAKETTNTTELFEMTIKAFLDKNKFAHPKNIGLNSKEEFIERKESECCK